MAVVLSVKDAEGNTLSDIDRQVKFYFLQLKIPRVTQSFRIIPYSAQLDIFSQYFYDMF